MTHDRDKKRQIRAKAQRDGISYVEARRRFERGAQPGGPAEPPDSSPGSTSPLRTMPLLVRSRHPAGFDVGLISLDQVPGYVMLRMRTSLASDDHPRLSVSIRDGAGVLLLRPTVGGFDSLVRSFCFDGELPAGTTELLAGIAVSDGDEHLVAVTLSGERNAPVPVSYQAVAEPGQDITAARSADDLLPAAIAVMRARIDGPDELPNYLTSIEHWDCSSVLNVYQDSGRQGTQIPGRFVAFDAHDRRYDSLSDGGGSWGDGMLSRHRVVPRIASDAGSLTIYTHVDGAPGEQVAAVDLS